MREGNNRDIYYVPAGSTNEFLLYAFNAQVGEVLNDLYLGGFEENGYSGRVEAISDGSPRLFTIRVLYPDGMGAELGESFSVTWIEGVGSPETPCGLAVVPPSPADVGTFSLLCAYNKGEQVYVSEMGKQYGCEYNQTPLLPSLCDEWNVLRRFPSNMGASPDEYYTQHYRLTSDTVIYGQIFRKLYKENSYSGAMREGTNRDIYYVPAESTHEYLLYAFNAQVGDTISNLWVEGYQQEVFKERYADGWTMIVREIQETTQRTYILSYTCEGCSYPYYNKAIVWLEGVGYPAGPIGSDIPFDFEIFMPQLLCAYKNGEQVYVSNMGEQYGCEYNYNPDSTPSDTIPLYIKDGPGSSTIEPVDPNEIIAKLILDELQMKEYLHTVIDYNLTKAPAANSSPAVKHINPVVAADSFTDSETVTLTESGRYFLEMSHPDWDYTIVGTFVYNALQGLETIENSQSACTKELREGQLLIRQGEQLYTPTGIRIQ